MPAPVVRVAATGLAGTTAMTVTTAVQRRLRRRLQHSRVQLPVDYDASGHVVTAAAAVLRIEPGSTAQRRALFALVHWGYGSAMATVHTTLRRRGVPPGRAAVIFYVTCQGMAFTLFPLLGGTPPPWRWRRDVLVSSFGQHAVYVLAVALSDQVSAPSGGATR